MIEPNALFGRSADPTTGKENGNMENGMNFFTLFVSSHPCESSTDSSDNFHE